MQIQLLLTGNEIMAGDTVDSNSAVMAEFLGKQGWSIYKKVTIADSIEQLCEEIKAAAATSDLLIINGGLGPTVDDLTSQALALVSETALTEHPEAMAHLEQWCGERRLNMNAANRKQAFLPANADIIANATGSAVGIQLQIGNCLVCATPGVPSEMRVMMEAEILPLLIQRFPSDNVEIRRLATFGVGESSLQNLISQRIPDWPESIDLGFRASMPILEVKLTAKTDEGRNALDHWQHELLELIGDAYLGKAPCSLASCVIDSLGKHGLTACTAESCTGGLIASQITEVSGASDVFHGGFVTYSNAMKTKVLSVPEITIEEHGAVSKQTAAAMLVGALNKSGADVGIAVTGVAGPSGGTDDKPVGTVCIAWGSKDDFDVRQFHMPFPRKQFQLLVAAAGLDLLRRKIEGLDPESYFFKRRVRS